MFCLSTLSVIRSFRLMNNAPAVDELNEVVRASDQFQKAEAAARSIKIPTGTSSRRTE
jgi:hypothetical protein